MSIETPDLLQLLTSLNADVQSTLATLPEVEVEDGKFKAEEIPSSTSNKWIKLPEVVAVVFDLKGSTKLGLGRHDTSSARIYKSGVEGAVRVLHDFGADFIDIQGDGGFGLFWGEKAHERALCAGVTVKTFGVIFVENLAKKFGENLPPTGYKVGMHAGRTLVKKIGTPRNPAEQEPVWAGKPINYAFKCAQSADADELIMTEKVWQKFKTNDYVTFSCGCSDEAQPTETLWKLDSVPNLPGDENEVRILTSGWCLNCGPSFIEAIMDGKRTRSDIPVNARHALPISQMTRALEAKTRQDLQSRRDRQFRI